MNDVTGDITELLSRAKSGDRDAEAELFAKTYEKLKDLAASRIRNLGGSPLQVTEVVNEAYLRLGGIRRVRARSRLEFYTLAGMAMRSAMIDEIRMRETLSRGGGAGVSRLRAEPSVEPDGIDKAILSASLSESMDRLRDFDEESWQILLLQYFAGMNNQTIAELIGIPRSTIQRRTRLARAFLLSQLNGGSEAVIEDHRSGP